MRLVGVVRIKEWDYQNSLPCILKNVYAFSDKGKHVKSWKIDVNYLILIFSTSTHIERGKNGNES